MGNLEIFLVVGFAGFFSAIIKNSVGVGCGIFLLPVLSLIFPAKIALGLAAPLMLASDLIGLRLYWRQWAPLRDLLRLLLPAIPGLLVGIWLVPIIPGGLFRTGVGVFGILYALGMLFPAAPPAKALGDLSRRILGGNQTTSAILFGFLGGIATVMAHAGGLVWSLYLVTTTKDKRVFVSTLVIIFFITNLYKTGAYIKIGILDSKILFYSLISIPLVSLGALAGKLINTKMHNSLFRNIVLIIILIVSALLLIEH